MKPVSVSRGVLPAAVPVLHSVVNGAKAPVTSVRRHTPRRDRDAWDGFRSDMRRKVWLERSLARLNRALQHGQDAEAVQGLRDEIEGLKQQLADVNAQIADRALLAAQCHEDFGMASASASTVALWIRAILPWLSRGA